MCGIVGYIGKKDAYPILIKGLRRLEYRGYDSAGVALLNAGGDLNVYKTKGKVDNLTEYCNDKDVSGCVGIAHTRWATHGAPTDRNAHPHLDCSGRIAIVHNGIIENYQQLRRQLLSAGHHFTSDTDSEVIAHLVEEAWAGPAHGDLAAAVRNACDRLEGSWGLAVVCADVPGTLVVTRNGSPLVVA